MIVDREESATRLIADVPEAWLEELRLVAEDVATMVISVDLSPVERFGTRELNELLKLQRRLRQAGRKLVLERPCEHVRDVFRLTRSDRVIEIIDSGEEPHRVLGR